MNKYISILIIMLLSIYLVSCTDNILIDDEVPDIIDTPKPNPKEVEISIAGSDVKVTMDPALYLSNHIEYIDTSNKIVLYTPRWHYEKTNRLEDATEYVAIINTKGLYTITEINNLGNQEIPLNGIIISVPNNMEKVFNIGDEINQKSVKIENFSYAIKTNKGVRLALDDINSKDSYRRFIYYNYLYGKNTQTLKTNTSELIIHYDQKLESFKISQKSNEGNNDIPLDGFVISTNGEPNKSLLLNNLLFDENDLIELINFDFINLEETYTHPFNGIGGLRLTDYILVYESPSKSSNQNIYGYEAAVNKDGIVVEKNVLVDIPEGGFVLSGHGINRTFIMNEIKLGSKITYDNHTKKITINNHLINQAMFELNTSYLKSKNEVDEALTNYYDVNDIENSKSELSIIEDSIKILNELSIELNNTYDPGKVILFNQHKNNIMPLFNQVYLNTRVSRKIETRGIWHRPNELNLDEVKSLLDTLENLNFTDIYLETFWNGYVVYKSSIAPYHVMFNESDFGPYNDYLDAFLSEAKLRNIHVHAWVENFFVGTVNQHSNLWEKYSYWRNKDILGNEVVTNKPGGEEEGFLFFDPANNEAREFIINIYKEIVNFDIKGLQLDYIRYPSGNDYVVYSTGYTETAMNEFKILYNYTGNLVMDVQTNKELYNQWNLYRQNKINTFVERIYNEIKPLKNDLMLSIAVGPNAVDAKTNLMQDWETWVTNGYIDAVLPMAYVNDEATLESIIIDLNKITKDLSYSFVGIAPTYYNLPDIYNATYMDRINYNNSHGHAIFASHNIINNENVKSIIINGLYKNKAISITDSIHEILKVFVDDIKHKFTNIYIPNDLSTKTKYNILVNKLNDLSTKTYDSKQDQEILLNSLVTIKLELNEYVDQKAYNNLNNYFNYFINIIEIKTTR
ncbi:glycoside hydrolase family 10 protein [Acholeplasma granularum]|uniref:glycoside hydrolase family 10 protein n=1 Tax=Acholeplasma granularum TaxID=264635 RepID=UPI0004701F59|nr:family 10 glycosylhydrolase [Acholeplasma granularum]